MAAFPSTMRTLVNRLATAGAAFFADLLRRTNGLGLLELHHQVEPSLGVGWLKPHTFLSEQFLAVLAQVRAEHGVCAEEVAHQTEWDTGF